MPPNRRQILAALLAAPQLRAADVPAIPGKRPMILHNDRPEALAPPDYRLNLPGLLSKPAQLTLADLQKLPQHTVPATLECTGNGRAFYTPKVPGIQWGRGAVGNAEWTGPRLGDVLKLA